MISKVFSKLVHIYNRLFDGKKVVSKTAWPFPKARDFE